MQGYRNVNPDFGDATVYVCDREINNFIDRLILYPQSIPHCLLPKNYY